MKTWREKKMKKKITQYFICSLIIVFGFLGIGNAEVSLNVDSAPNVYGSAVWGPWWNQAKMDVTSGTFINMRTGHFPGTEYADPYDEIVYSTMDLGKRLHWIYWLPGKTTAELEGLFEVKWVIDWGGIDYTYEGGGWAIDGPEIGWSQPTRWEDYSNNGISGVIGNLGFAWWATDNDAVPLDGDGNPYNEVDQADIDALRQIVFDYQTYALGMVRYRASESDPWQITSLKVFITEVVVDIKIRPRKIELDDDVFEDDDDDCDDDGKIKVIILTTPDFDALRVDPTTVALGDPALGGTAVPIKSKEKDVGRDGDTDLVLVFSICDLVRNGALAASTTELQLTGKTIDGFNVIGSGNIKVRVDD
jgi:hypothetical protein